MLSRLAKIPIGIRSPLTVVALCVLVLIGTQGAHAERVVIPVSQQVNDVASDLVLPSNGMSKEVVIENYGEPVKRIPAVGTPKIGRWEYTDYYVYFENDIVLHAVVKHQYALQK